ncbi:hypothetical protein J7T55_001286 [Diaporthe amygdali]|uniref:uncharacterized protein n=1 Tax=Phomopsis amygdali TaxID=1214568 RepID=UPI0022FE9410|nr:uncharacterized protein J7T55_001286 [Diaporthe amygdali]KAJ0106762.1 hypothetical protein J7T55_001286 [Diaporthe amygdali]
MAELKRLTLIAALSCMSSLGLAQSGSSSSSSSTTTKSSKTKVIQTTNYIDTIDGYSSLSSCAIDVLSTVVRGEFSGCGGWDDNLTSYTCFCTDSYSFMSTVISTDVLTSCADDSAASAQATSAISIFDKYCALGVEAGLEPTSESGSSNPTASPGATGSSSTATGSPSSDSGANSSRTTAIAVGVVVPVVVIAIAVSAWLIWRKRRAAKAGNWDQWNRGNTSGYGNGPVRDANAVEAPTYEQKTEELPYSPHNASEMSSYSPHSTAEMASYQHHTAEMPDTQHRQELPG